MKRYKRLFALMLAGVPLLFVCRCGDGQNHPGSAEPPLETQAQLIVEIDISSDERAVYRADLKKLAARENGAVLKLTGLDERYNPMGVKP